MGYEAYHTWVPDPDPHADRRDAQAFKVKKGMKVTNTSIRRLAELALAPKKK